MIERVNVPRHFSADFIQANGIYKWKGITFAIYKVILVIKFVAVTMTELNTVYLA